jgi:dihydropteroate synthase
MIHPRPIAMQDAARPKGAFTLAGGWCWFDRVELLERGQPARLVSAMDLPRPLPGLRWTVRA